MGPFLPQLKLRMSIILTLMSWGYSKNHGYGIKMTKEWETISLMRKRKFFRKLLRDWEWVPKAFSEKVLGRLAMRYRMAKEWGAKRQRENGVLTGLLCGLSFEKREGMHMLRWGKQNFSICNFNLAIGLQVLPVVLDINRYLLAFGSSNREGHEGRSIEETAQLCKRNWFKMILRPKRYFEDCQF